MITTDPRKRARTLHETTELIARAASAEERELLLSFAQVVFAEMPDRLVFNVDPSVLARRLQEHFRFVVREMPPAIQLYRGVPGIHVSVRNPSEEEAAATGTGSGLPLRTTVVETHTLDAPFIFDSLKHYFSKAGLRVFSAIHPIYTVRRQWERIVWLGGPHEEGSKEVYCHFQIELVESKERLRRMEHEIFAVLKSVFLAVEDFEKMGTSVGETASRLRSRRGDSAEAESARAFIDWLRDENYIFFGTARYKPGAGTACEQIPESVNGVFRDAALLPLVFPALMEELEARVLPGPKDNRIVGLDFCKNASAIYHLDPIDYIVLREWGEDGSFTGATLLLGRFARGTFMQRANRIPILREKAEAIVRESGALPNSHVYREIRATFNRLPIRELFYAPRSSLKAIIEPIVYLTGDEEIAIHCREGAGYVALSVIFSRLKYSYDTEIKLSDAFSDAFGPVVFHTNADCGPVSLILFYFDAAQMEHPVQVDAVREIMTPLVTSWETRAAAALEAALGEREGRRLFRRYVRLETRSGLYREVTAPEETPADLQCLERLEAQLEGRVSPRSPNSSTLHIYSMKPLGLTEALRTLQNLGLTVTEELRIPLTLPEARKGYIYRFEVEAAPAIIKSLHGGEDRFIEALRAVDEGRGTDDALNSLILLVGMTWRQVELLRTVRNHLLQIRTHYNVETVNQVLRRNSRVASSLFDAFAARLDPGLTGDRAVEVEKGEKEVEAALASVTSLAEDEVLRALGNLISSSLRTNFFQRPERPVISIKVDSKKVEGMPSPRPLFEIYVHGRLLEGIHLRGGTVARGGIRWSDRHDDFRTEILGLMKTQMVKNSVIVPVGSKGGFVLKGNLPARPAFDAYLIDRYREFVSGLLDVTDNLLDGKIVHPPEVVRHDSDDPYLVVAADKGTAHLSDTANSVSAQYGFWLGDAFASGGSVGYDHKQVGITARGVWECVKHHFRNIGVDIQSEPFTVCGIGDMAGDVFGNGMLLSRTTKLVAAFNHAHIFVDPSPDPEKSFRERERLFKLPRSAWSDYDRSLIGRGGGIFDRSAKAIQASPEMRALFEIESDSISGEEMIRRILAARVDLLYNGGIGTYIKGSAEDNEKVGDRANDRVRICGAELRAKVVAEGGNLGLTQRGRLEYWSHGGRINTDALDNSAGVDMSDHEVNIKILLDMLVKKGIIKGKDERNRILAEMTEEVAGLVLADNENQSRALTLDEMRSASRYEEFVALVEEMVSAHIINRVDEDVPTREELLSGAGRDRGLPRPLLAKLLGYCKMWAFDRILGTGLPDSPVAQPFLEAYFPKRMRAQFSSHFQEHTLRREIIATAVVNHLINNVGISFLARLTAGAKTGIGEVAAAYLEVERAASAPALRGEVLSAGLKAQAEHDLLREIEEALESSTVERLQGKTTTKAPKMLKEIGARLKR